MKFEIRGHKIHLISLSPIASQPGASICAPDSLVGSCEADTLDPGIRSALETVATRHRCSSDAVSCCHIVITPPINANLHDLLPKIEALIPEPA